jgi:hypothetical protein
LADAAFLKSEFNQPFKAAKNREVVLSGGDFAEA